MSILSREESKRDELRFIWEQKELSMSKAAVDGRNRRAVARLKARGIVRPTMRDIDRERFNLEDERFVQWYQGKVFSGFDRT